MYAQQDSGNITPESYSMIGVQKQLTRYPISIFKRINETESKEKKKKLEGLLRKLEGELPSNFKIGAAVDAGDCFFDSIAQGLNELKNNGLITSDKNFNVKSLREDCANSAGEYKGEIIKDAKGGGYAVALQGPYGSIEDPKTREDKIDDEKTFRNYVDKMKKTFEGSGNAIWGRPEIEGKIICKKYKVKIKVIELRDEQVDGLHVTTDEVGTGNHIVYIMNYRSHFVPLLSKIIKNIEESKEVSRKEVYGNVVNSNLENILHSKEALLWQSSTFHARGPYKKNCPSEDVRPSKFISETLDKKNCRELLKQEDIANKEELILKSQDKENPASARSLLDRSSKEFIRVTKERNFEVWLENLVIDDIAKYLYKWTKDNNVIFGVEDCAVLPRKLDEFKRDRGKILIYIVNKDGNHWVTLVAVHADEQKDVFFYADSYGRKIDECLVNGLGRGKNTNSNMQNKGSHTRSIKYSVDRDGQSIEQNSDNDVICLGVVSPGQSKNNSMTRPLDEFLEEKGHSKDNIFNLSLLKQKDSYNCGVFALENAKAILDAVRGGDYDVDKVKKSLERVSEDTESLHRLRIKFAHSLEKAVSSDQLQTDNEECELIQLLFNGNFDRFKEQFEKIVKDSVLHKFYNENAQAIFFLYFFYSMVALPYTELGKKIRIESIWYKINGDNDLKIRFDFKGKIIEIALKDSTCLSVTKCDTDYEEGFIELKLEGGVGRDSSGEVADDDPDRDPFSEAVSDADEKKYTFESSLDNINKKEDVRINVEEMFKTLGSLFNLNNSESSHRNKEVAQQGFVFGFLMLCCKRKYKVECNTGKGRADLVFLLNNGAKDGIPILVEFKAGEYKGATKGIEQIKELGYLCNLNIAMETKSTCAVIVGVNFTHSNDKVKVKNENIIQSKNVISELLQECTSQGRLERKEENIKKLFKPLYYLIPNTGGGTNRCSISRLFAGQLLLKDKEFDKKIDKYFLLHNNRNVTFVLIKNNKAFVINFIEVSRRDLRSCSEVKDVYLPNLSNFADPPLFKINIIVNQNEKVFERKFDVKVQRIATQCKQFCKGIMNQIRTEINIGKLIKDLTSHSIEKLSGALCKIKGLVGSKESMGNENYLKAIMLGLFTNDKFAVLPECNAFGKGPIDLIVCSRETNDLTAIELKYDAENFKGAEQQLSRYLSNQKIPKLCLNWSSTNNSLTYNNDYKILSDSSNCKEIAEILISIVIKDLKSKGVHLGEINSDNYLTVQEKDNKINVLSYEREKVADYLKDLMLKLGNQNGHHSLGQVSNFERGSVCKENHLDNPQQSSSGFDQGSKVNVGGSNNQNGHDLLRINNSGGVPRRSNASDGNVGRTNSPVALYSGPDKQVSDNKFHVDNVNKRERSSLVTLQPNNPKQNGDLQESDVERGSTIRERANNNLDNLQSSSRDSDSAKLSGVDGDSNSHFQNSRSLLKQEENSYLLVSNSHGLGNSDENYSNTSLQNSAKVASMLKDLDGEKSVNKTNFTTIVVPHVSPTLDAQVNSVNESYGLDGGNNSKKQKSTIEEDLYLSSDDEKDSRSLVGDELRLDKGDLCVSSSNDKDLYLSDDYDDESNSYNLVQSLFDFTRNGRLNELLSCGQEFSQVCDSNGDTLLHCAAENNRSNLIVYLSNKIDVNFKNKNGKTPLYYAIGKNDDSIVKKLLSCGADINVRDNDGKTPLDFAIKERTMTIVELLLSNKTLKDDTKKEALFTAVDSLNTRAINSLLKENVDDSALLNYLASSNCDITSLYSDAIRFHLVNLFEVLLLRKEFYIDAKDTDGITLLSRLKLQQCATMIDLLQQKGIKIEKGEISSSCPCSLQSFTKDNIKGNLYRENCSSSSYHYDSFSYLCYDDSISQQSSSDSGPSILEKESEDGNFLDNYTANQHLQDAEQNQGVSGEEKSLEHASSIEQSDNIGNDSNSSESEKSSASSKSNAGNDKFCKRQNSRGENGSEASSSEKSYSRSSSTDSQERKQLTSNDISEKSTNEDRTLSSGTKRLRTSDGSTQKPPGKKVAQSDSSRQEVKIKSNVGNDESDEQQDSSRESGSEISGLLSSSSGSQEVEHTASNDISERSSGDGGSVYSPPEQNSGSSLERGKGSWHTKICRVIEEGAENRIQLLRALIRDGENPGHIGHDCSPLPEAAQKCDEEVVRFLVDECKVDVNIEKSCSGKNAIFYAIKKNNTEIAEFLFSRGAKVDFYSFENLVGLAANAGNVSILRTLVDNCTQARFFIHLDRFPLMKALGVLTNDKSISHEIRDLLKQNRSKLCTPHPSYGQESDTEENNLWSGSQESSTETSDSQPNSPSFQEVEHTASNDISEKSFGDEESVYSSLEQNSSSSLERGKGSCSPISHDLDGTDKNYDSTLQQSNAESESLNNVQPDLNRNGNIPLHVAAQNGHLNVAGTRIDVGSFFKEVTPLFNALNIEMRSPKTTLNSVALDNQLRRRSASF
ncbi:MAG: ankyrin repeat domain-containing protein [Wolbachia sp.]|uniref:ankyrin repeat domain-containing protein n=1 Tax=Wolbachia endosymbiont (group A) of Calamotropha paludella TaxID=2953989 RepID=UPI00222FDAD7|nr:ankyrin repeat domain-containing protein [Wolbachia endosymbiont (group A) of Calamotropha paludella]